MKFTPLLEEKNPRTFLKAALSFQKPNNRPISISEFSGRCGFSSRSFLSDYIKGKKNLSKESWRSIRSALKLPKEYKEYFTLLVVQDQPELKILKSQNISDDLKRLRKTILRKNEFAAKTEKDSFRKALSKKSCYLIFASLGTDTHGASLEEICRRSKLPVDTVNASLDTLLESGLAEKKEDKYFATNSNYDFLNFSGTELVQLFQELSSEIAASPSNLLDNSKSTFVYSAMSLDSRLAKQFRERLREVIYEVMDEYQLDSGDCVQEVLLLAQG